MKKLTEGGFLITKIHHLTGRIFFRMLKDHGLGEINPGQGRILFALWKEDGIPIQELARRTQLGKSTLTSMLDRLEQAGLLRRVPSKKDRRKILIEVTERQREMERSYEAVSLEMAKLFYQGFSEAEIDEFEDYLKRILDNLIKSENE
ncbi:MAG TPA: MarR family transcriptional regulator [Acidobacteriota bacterium]|nr:MarR family transcriptional regulator [Acidobacteriota bacterium]